MCDSVKIRNNIAIHLMGTKLSRFTKIHNSYTGYMFGPCTKIHNILMHAVSCLKESGN